MKLFKYIDFNDIKQDLIKKILNKLKFEFNVQEEKFKLKLVASNFNLSYSV